MSINTCDPCLCPENLQAASRSVDTFRQANLAALCSIYNAISGGSGGIPVEIPLSQATGLTGYATGNVGWFRKGSYTTLAGSTTTNIESTNIGTAGTAEVGDIIVVRSGAGGIIDQWTVVTEIVDNDNITVSPPFTTALGAGISIAIQAPQPIASTRAASGSGSALHIAMDNTYAGSGANNLLKIRDVASGASDVGVAAFGIRNDSQSILTGANLDYTPLSVSDRGQLASTPIPFGSSNSTRSWGAVRFEDDALLSGQAMMICGTQREDIPSVTVSANGDLQPFKSTASGKLWVEPSGLQFNMELITVAFSSIGAAYASTGVPTGDPKRAIRFLNDTDADVTVSSNAGVTDGLVVLAGSEFTIDLATNGMSNSAAMYIKRTSGAPTAGNFYITYFRN